MTEDIYSQLRRRLDTFLLGAPEAPSILEILRIRYSPEEAETALLLGDCAMDLSTLAKSSGRNEEDLRAMLERMADKALIYKKTKQRDGVVEETYSLLPTAVGLWETSFATGERNPRTEMLAQYWREYYESGWGKQLHASNTAFTRVIPVAKSIMPQQEVYSYERASELIRQYDYACVLHCPCRKSAELAGKGCGKPTEVCVHVGHLARFFVERGYAREVSQKEVLNILDITEKAGLVHMVGNSKQMGVAICSCCTCCCTMMRAISEMSKPDAIAKSRFKAEVDEDACIACGTCDQRCQVHAITYVEAIATISEERCIGCGLCVTECPVTAIVLKERPAYQEPVATGMELAQAFVAGRQIPR